MRDCVDLQRILKSTLFDTEEAFCRKLKRYARFWLEETEDGRRYAVEYRLFQYVLTNYVKCFGAASPPYLDSATTQERKKVMKLFQKVPWLFSRPDA